MLSIAVRDFRGYENATSQFGSGLTVVCGPNGAGKTNLLEALYFGCTGYSCRTSNERELVRFGHDTLRVVVRTEQDGATHELAVGFSTGSTEADVGRRSVRGTSARRAAAAAGERLPPGSPELVKGVPALRRAHLDRFVAALWPARAVTRRAYAQALAQRNAVIVRLRGGARSADMIDAWDLQLARTGIALMEDRRRASELIVARFAQTAGTLGLDGDPAIAYRPRSRAANEAELVAELRARLERDVERGFTLHGPHRDDLAITRGGRELRAFGSQGQQRIALLALLLAERDVLADLHRDVPLLLLDDVMSELDGHRRAALVDLLRSRAGQALITTTDAEHVPGSHDAAMARIDVRPGHDLDAMLAA